MTLDQIAQSDVVTADENASVMEIVQLMDDEDVGSVVVTENGDVAGIVTDRQIALSLREAEDPTELNVADLMTEDPTTVPSDTGVFELIATMSEQGVRRIPVVEDGTLAGIVTLDDVVVLLAEELNNVGEVVEKQSPRF